MNKKFEEAIGLAKKIKKGFVISYDKKTNHLCINNEGCSKLITIGVLSHLTHSIIERTETEDVEGANN